MTKLKLQSLRNYRDESRKKLPDYTYHIEEIIALGEPEENGFTGIPGIHGGIQCLVAQPANPRCQHPKLTIVWWKKIVNLRN